MPLSPPSTGRELLHERDIQCRGYRRLDGLWDVEAWLQDRKTYGFPNHDRTFIAAGENLHGLGLRLTVDEFLKIHAAEACLDDTPYRQCPEAAAPYQRLCGLVIGPGFERAARAALAGGESLHGTACTHLTELLRPLATTAFQTVYAARERRRQQENSGKKPVVIDTCHALRSDGPVVQRQWPDFYSPPES